MVRNVRGDELRAYETREHGPTFHILDVTFARKDESAGYRLPYTVVDPSYDRETSSLPYAFNNSFRPKFLSFDDCVWASTPWRTPLFSAIVLTFDHDFCPMCIIDLDPIDALVS